MANESDQELTVHFDMFFHHNILDNLHIKIMEEKKQKNKLQGIHVEAKNFSKF